EIQYAPELFPYLKMAVDRKRMPGMFWLTGSQQFHMMRNVSESLAGRVGIVQLMGLSRRELTKAIGTEPFPHWKASHDRHLTLQPLYQLIWRGAYPEVALNKKLEKNLFYNSYVQTYIQRDVRDLAKVGDELAFFRFLRACAARTGQLLNYSELAKDTDIAPNTAKTWLSVLQASGIIYLLPPYHTNVTKRLVKAPKLYFCDTGLCSYLTEWSSPETLEAGAMSGAILETWALMEILKSYLHNGESAPFYYYRDKDKKEIDLLILRDGKICPIEFKKTASPSRRDVHHFSVLEKLGLPVEKGGVVCLAQQSLPLTENTISIPISEL
ncbi:MAG: ATP-binding protein, partial [Holophagae bacterium]|nr:ATP-binding protein [Holophagae bacterium]